jgi:LAO/AO transport system kinase
LKIVTISGASKDVGKTSLAVSIIARHKDLAAVKYSLHHSEKEAGVVTDPEVLAHPGTDTARFLEAGAKPVFWVQTHEKRLGLDLKKALSLLPPRSKVIIEGNSVLKHLRPAFAIFVMNSSWDKVKSSALEALKVADVIVAHNGDETSTEKILSINPGATLLVIDPLRPAGAEFDSLLKDLREIWREDMKEKILDAVRAASKEGRIACHNARKVAEELEVPYREVGQAANELKVKIVQCELGCF